MAVSTATAPLKSTFQPVAPVQTPARAKTGMLSKSTKPAPAPQPDKVSPWMVMGLTGLFACSLLLYFHTVQVENQANQKQQNIISMKEENDRLQASLAELKTLQSVETKATSLGMEQVNSFNYISVSPEVYQMKETGYQTTVAPTARPIRVPLGF